MLASVFDSVVTVVGGVGFLLTSVTVVIWMRTHAERIVPWWWWWTAFFGLVLVGIGNDGLIQGALLFAAAMSLGVGVALLITGLRDGSIRLRRPHWLEAVAAEDLKEGANRLFVGEISLDDLDGLTRTEPSFTFSVILVNSSFYRARIEPEVKGHVDIDGTAIGESPELVEIEQKGKQRRLLGPPYESDIWLEHGDWARLTLRQFVTEKIAGQILSQAGKTGWFGFDGVDIGVSFANPSGTDGWTFISGRQRVKLYRLELAINVGAQSLAKADQQIQVGVSRTATPDTNIDPDDTTGGGYRAGMPAAYGWRIWSNEGGAGKWVGTHGTPEAAVAAAQEAQQKNPELASLRIVRIDG